MKTILIVDDEEELVEIIKTRLEASGYKVVSAFDGIDGLNKARSENPDLIILDIMLPKLDGYQICRILKFDEKYQNVPVLMFTARMQDSDKKKAVEAGANAYMTKPFEPKALLEKIKELMPSDATA